MSSDNLLTAQDREQLRHAIRTFLDRNWPAEKAIDLRMNAVATAQTWHRLEDLGLGTLCDGESGGGLQEAVMAMQELGRAACPAPLIGSLILNLLLPSQGDLAAPWPALRASGGMVAFSVGVLDQDRTATQLRVQGDRLQGQLRYIDVCAGTSHIAAIVSPTLVALIAVSEPGVHVTPTRALGSDGLATVHFDDAAAKLFEVPASQLQDAVLVVRLLQTARALGAASRAMELAVDYAKQRKQFGKVIGSFQAVSHKLVNNSIAVKSLKLSVDNTASHFDRRLPVWRMFASSAIAFAGQSLRQVSLETHHCFGAVGYAEEHEAPRHFKQVHMDVLRSGGARVAREALARYFLDDGGELPDYDLGEAANAFRGEVREWVGRHWSESRQEELYATDHPNRDFHSRFALELGETGWLACNWPTRFGGQNRSALEYFAFVEEMARLEAPRAGASIQAAAWMMFGRPEQLERYLPELKRGEVMYGMWYSEPDSGSDLASIRTRAVRDGDHYIVNGQKIWTTTYWGDYMWLLAKTDPTAKPAHAGISLFCVPTNTPGVTMRPIKTMYDGEFVNTFFDDMRVPASCLVGEVNGGWKVLTESLRTERGIVGAVIVSRLSSSFQMVCNFLREALDANGEPLKDDPMVRQTVGSFAAQIDAARQIALDCVLATGSGETAPEDGAASKIVGSELMEQFFEAVQDMVGMEAALSRTSEGAVLSGKLEQRLRHALMWVISIGTNEIQRNVIAQFGLGLPR